MLLHRSTMIAVGASVGMCCAGLALADVTVQQKISVDGFGPLKIGAMQGTTTTAIAGDRARTDRDMQFNSKIIRMFAHGTGGNTVHIVRLDKELEYQIDPAKKQYSETTFADMRAVMAKGLKDAQSKSDKTARDQPSGAPVNESECQWSAPRTDVKKGTETQTIAGADTKRVTISVTTTCTDAAKNTSCDFVYLIDQWLAPEMPGADESRSFWRDYAKKLDITGDLAASMQANAQQVFQRYKGAWSEAMAKAGTVKGYPMKSVFAMQVGGPQCKGQDSAANSTPADTAPTSPSDAASGFALGLLAKLHKKPDETPANDAQPLPPGMIQMFQMTTEMVSINSTAVPANQFEVPDGYTKIESPMTK